MDSKLSQHLCALVFEEQAVGPSTLQFGVQVPCSYKMIGFLGQGETQRAFHVTHHRQVVLVAFWLGTDGECGFEWLKNM